MRLNRDRLEAHGIRVDVSSDGITIDIYGTEETPRELVDAYQILTKAVGKHLEGIAGFEADRLIDSFADKLNGVNLLNIIKELDESER